MRMFMSVIKFMVLVCLIASSVVQTGRLWFDDLSNRNLFYQLFRDEDLILAETLSETGNLLSPSEIGVYLGTDKIEYTMLKSSASGYQEILEDIKKIISEGATEANYIGSVEDESLIFEGRHYFIHLPYDLTKSMLKANFGLKEQDLPMVGAIRNIYLRPATNLGDQYIALYLEEGDGSLIHEYMVTKETMSLTNDLLLDGIAKIEVKENLSAFISTKKNQLPYFSENVLIPVLYGNLRYHESLYFSTPYIVGEAYEEEALKSYLGNFFTNPDIMTRIPNDNDVRYSDGTVTVRYNKKGLLEVNRADSVSRITDVSAAITVANQFLQRDFNTQNLFEVNLVGLETQEGMVKLYYDLGFAGFPITFDERMQESYGMSHPIEVTVSGTKVVKYKRLVRTMEDILPQDKIFNMPYELVLDQVIGQKGNLEDLISDLYLAYAWTPDGDEVILKWVVDYDQATDDYVEVVD